MSRLHWVLNTQSPISNVKSSGLLRLPPNPQRIMSLDYVCGQNRVSFVDWVDSLRSLRRRYCLTHLAAICSWGCNPSWRKGKGGVVLGKDGRCRDDHFLTKGKKKPCYLGVHSRPLFCSSSTSTFNRNKVLISSLSPFLCWGKTNSWGLKERRREVKTHPKSFLQSFQFPFTDLFQSYFPTWRPSQTLYPANETNSSSLLSSLTDTWNPYWYFPATFCPKTSLKPKGSVSRYVVAHRSPGCHALSSAGAIQGNLVLSSGLYCWPWTTCFPTTVKLGLKQNIISSTDTTYKLPVVWVLNFFFPIFAGVFCT